MLVELSVPFYPGMPRYDDSIPDVVFSARTRSVEGDPNNTTSVNLFLHSGSHVDAPFHFDPHGRTIDQIPVEKFAYRSVVLALAERWGDRGVGRKILEDVPGIKQADLLLIYTGYSKWIHDPVRYRQGFPGIDLEAARFLRRELPGLVAVGTDALSIESEDPTGLFQVHHELLDERDRVERSLLVFENLNLMPLLEKTINHVWAFPLRFAGLDAAPVAMVADVEDAV